MKKLLFALIGFFLLFPGGIFAAGSADNGSGKQQIQEKLSAGMIYKLPSLKVSNTTSTAADYEVVTSYHQAQHELQPAQTWFRFSPTTFHLKPGQSQTVEVKISLPLVVTPGNYFAYVEAHAIKKTQAGTSVLNTGVSSKLFFTVVPTSFGSAVSYRLTSFWHVFAPWPLIGVITVIVLALLLVALKIFHPHLNLRRWKPRVRRPLVHKVQEVPKEAEPHHTHQEPLN